MSPHLTSHLQHLLLRFYILENYAGQWQSTYMLVPDVDVALYPV